MSPTMRAMCLTLFALSTGAAAAFAADSDTASADSTLAVLATPLPQPGPAVIAHRRDGLEALVPELANGAYSLAPGPRPFSHRLAVTPGFGTLGSQALFTMRVAFNPTNWLAYEGMIGDNPSQAVHAIVHMFNAIVRRPMQGRVQPYLSAGYGMTIVLPGKSVNADPVTKNTLAMGGGLELYIRDDLALRAEMRQSTVLGRQQNRDGVVAYNYREQTLGLVFYRSITP